MAEGHSWTDLAAGDEFAGYRIEQRLGRGGMGILYLAVEPGLERRVALKLIAPEAAADPVFTRRFAEESRIAASIEHPNVVPIYAAGEEDGVPYIAMRYVAGSDLGRRITREGRLAPAPAVALIAQVGNGLDAIHAAGLIHRDVKPANVLLSGEAGSEHAYITDFGVARNLDTESGLTQTGRFVGTLDYVAPEQISGEPVDARVDVYALGCLLFKLLTGEVPFPREGEAARLYAHLNDPPPAASLYEPSVPMALDDVIARALSKSPDDRYPSAGDLGRAAEAALAGTAVAVPERTVATGAAATRERTMPTASPRSGPREEQTRRLPDEPQAARRSRRPLLIGAGVLALVAAAALAIVLAAGGGEEGAGTASGQTTTTETTPPKEAKEKKPKPETLTTAALIRQGDEICEDSQDTYRSYRERFPAGEEEADAVYSQLLVNISSRAVKRFQELKPSAALKDPYDAYVKAQEEVAKWDKDALKAAEREDLSAYLAAREERNNTAGEREELADAVGFEKCSQPQ
ncbi:MAG TPA: serine/threonine-protein kinase [Solirubrobacterales bacterium]|nr:serine/threonine-protein kinase [Solirubrobacterales bacterium]